MNNPRVGVGAVILNEASEILLLKRLKSPEMYAWSIPGGKVDWMETIEEAIVREIEEELGVSIELIRLVGVTNHILPDEQAHWVAPTYLAKIAKGEPRNMEPNKHEAIGWFALDDLPEPLTLTTTSALRDLQQMIY
ncbi:NUDIX hydrolase [Savagea faecisuis]|uniref:NUDIX domain-containing protein n=1 Tax=Savagea faecisuis TaxID=1274803 RepID=A0ABW3GXX4_9BACL